MNVASRRHFVVCSAGVAISLLRLRTAHADEPQMVGMRTPSGYNVSASLSVPASTPVPAVILIPGSTGLDDHNKALPTVFSEAGFLALAVDTFDGQTATDRAGEVKLYEWAMGNQERVKETLLAWLDWLQADTRSNGKIAAVGWSSGARWALITSGLAKLDATVIYYGGAGERGVDLSQLKGPVLGHFGENDTSPHPNSVKKFAEEMADAGKTLDVRWYAADHAFDYPPFPTYDGDAAVAATRATIEFLRATLS